MKGVRGGGGRNEGGEGTRGGGGVKKGRKGGGRRGGKEGGRMRTDAKVPESSLCSLLRQRAGFQLQVPAPGFAGSPFLESSPRPSTMLGILWH